MKRYRPIYVIACVLIALCVLGYLLVSPAHFDVLSPSGAIAKQQHSLLLFALGLSALVVIPVFTMLGMFAWKYREGAGGKHQPEWGENRALETLWWGIPIIVIVVLAVVAWRTSHTLDPYRPIASESKTLEVQVVAMQWKWLFLYPNKNIATVNKLVIPENVRVHFTITADAPMSAFWVPALGTQIYAMNGMSSQLNLIADHTGQFNGYSTNINGKGYSDMVFTVDALSVKDFNAWTDGIAGSSQIMNKSAYEKLSQPGTAPKADYALPDTSLYGTIMSKYMSDNTVEHSNMGGCNMLVDLIGVICRTTPSRLAVLLVVRSLSWLSLAISPISKSGSGYGKSG